MRSGRQSEPELSDLSRMHVTLLRLYARAVQRAEAEQAESEQEEAAGRLGGQPAAASTGDRNERNSQCS